MRKHGDHQGADAPVVEGVADIYREPYGRPQLQPQSSSCRARGRGGGVGVEGNEGRLAEGERTEGKREPRGDRQLERRTVDVDTGEREFADRIRVGLGPEGWDRPPLGQAYHGSAVTLEASVAKKAGKLIKALTLIDEGTKEIDSAEALDPGSIALRLLRIENSLALVEGSPVDRKPQATGDISYLRTRWTELKPEEKAIVDLDSGRLSLADRRLGEAMASWRAAIRDAPDSDAASRARKLLAHYGD